MSVRCQSIQSGLSTWFVSAVFRMPRAVSTLIRSSFSPSGTSIHTPTRLTELELSTSS
jgi:hypothetical protein